MNSYQKVMAFMLGALFILIVAAIWSQCQMSRRAIPHMMMGVDEHGPDEPQISVKTIMVTCPHGDKVPLIVKTISGGGYGEGSQ